MAKDPTEVRRPQRKLVPDTQDRRALVIIPATGGRGFSRSSAQAPLILFEISGNATG
jgi:hypothetical protein